jgi:ABC-2 type transport system ATP-binding protein
VALLHEGGLLALDTPAALRATLEGAVMEIVAPDRDRVTAVLQRLPGVMDVQLFGERAHARFAPSSEFVNAERLIAALRQAGVSVEGVRRVPTSLEDVFIARVTKRES